MKMFSYSSIRDVLNGGSKKTLGFGVLAIAALAAGALTMKWLLKKLQVVN